MVTVTSLIGESLHRITGGVVLHRELLNNKNCFEFHLVLKSRIADTNAYTEVQRTTQTLGDQRCVLTFLSNRICNYCFADDKTGLSSWLRKQPSSNTLATA